VPLAVAPKTFDEIAAAAAKDEQMTAMRIARRAATARASDDASTSAPTTIR
jgi:hypothetical protein